MTDAPLSERIRAHGTGMPITPNDVTLIQMADEVAALEQALSAESALVARLREVCRSFPKEEE